MRHIGPAAMVADYRALWLRLSKLARDTGTATCYTFTFINLYLFLIITLSIYGLMSQLSEGFGIKDIGLAVTAFSSIGLLFFICDEAHYASHNVRTNFQKKLLMVELNWMNIDAQTEVKYSPTPQPIHPLKSSTTRNVQHWAYVYWCALLTLELFNLDSFTVDPAKFTLSLFL